MASRKLDSKQRPANKLDVVKLARSTGLSPGRAQRWAASDVKPHLPCIFKLSKNKRCEGNFWDVIGLYLDPQRRAIVLGCDEKSQCQALQRAQPGLVLGIGDIPTRNYDYVRYGTLTLFVALDLLEGRLITRRVNRHRRKGWLAFMKTLGRAMPANLDIHVIADNYVTHNHTEILQVAGRQ